MAHVHIGGASAPGPAAPSDHALKVIAAQLHADELVRRVVEGTIDADRLAVAIAPLYGVQLQAFARAICKALRRG